MRKITIGILCAGLLSLVISSCKKQDEKVAPRSSTTTEAPQNRTASTDGVILSPQGFLVFSSEALYEAKLHELALLNGQELDDWESGLGYTSLRHKLNEETESNPVVTLNRTADDDLFRTLINVNGMVQIGNYIFKASVDSGYVSELDVADMQYFDQFMAGEFIEGISNKFNLDEDDAFGKLDGGLKGSNELLRTPIFGSGDKYNDDLKFSPESATTWRADCKAQYQKAVFYFCLMTELKHMFRIHPDPFWTPNSQRIQLYCDYSWENKRGNTGNYLNFFREEYSATKLNYKAYAGSRGLKGGSTIKAKFYYQNVCTGYQLRLVPFILKATV